MTTWVPAAGFVISARLQRGKRAVVAPVPVDPDLLLIRSFRCDGGWTVTDSSGIPLGAIYERPQAFLISLVGRAIEPLDFESFDKAIDFFACYRAALGVGIT